ncbi:hypothetical protein [Nocardia sp. NPDC052566]|uniref:hypothetical protein n=1 Tax=Nocardia sp. NPDC052566 TaxID=3364330 RepID=UPI0037C9AB61
MGSPDPGACRQLAADLAALREEVGGPSYKMLHLKLKAICDDPVSVGTLYNAERGITPPKFATVRQFVAACRLVAQAEGLPSDTSRFAVETWRGLWEKTRKRGDSLSLCEPFAGAAKLRPLADPATAAQFQDSIYPVSKPIGEWSSEALRVHATVGGNRMVDYVLRPHDIAVRQAIDRALAGHGSRMIIVRGGSCTGKTRCAVEAVRDRIPHWSLVRPTGKDQLRQVLGGGVGASTVIWLDDIQVLLGNGDIDDVVMRLFEVLTDGCAVIAIGTMWGGTDFVDQLDLGIAVERLFDLNVEMIDVPSTFSASQIDDARRILGPEFGDVVDAAVASGELVQNLTGGPLLVQMYENADAQLYAVLTAAIDLFCIGHTLPIPEGMLREAASCYLSSRQRLRLRLDWFELAIRQAATPVKRAIAALEPARTAVDGEALDGFVLADFLGYYGKRHRSQPPHKGLWGIVATWAVNRSAARAVALEARRRLLYPETERLHRRTIELGWIGGWSDLARLALQFHDLSLADELVAAARADLGAAHGYPGYLWYEIALLYYVVDDPAAAETMLQNANDVFVDWSVVAKLREQHGDGLGADEAARKDCEREGIPTTWYEHLIPSRTSSGDFVGAERSAEAMAAAGFAYGWIKIGNELMYPYGDYRGAARAFQAAAERGIEDSWQDVGRALALLGEYEAAEQAMLRTALSDVDEPQYAWSELAALRHGRGDAQGAERAAEQGEGMGWARLASERAKDGQFGTAEVAAAKAASLGEGTGWADLAGEYERAGLQEEAERAARNAAPFESGGLFGGQDGWRQIIRQRCDVGDWDAAQRACSEYRDIDGEYAQRVLVTIYEHTGQHEEAKRIAQRNTESLSAFDTINALEDDGDSLGAEELAIDDVAVHGQVGLWWHIADLRNRRGDAATHYRLSRFGLHPDGTLRDKAAARVPSGNSAESR